MKTKIHKLTIIILVYMITLTGCGDQKTYEKMGYALQVGMESKDGKLVVSATLPVISDEKISSSYRLITNDNVIGARDAREKFRMKSPASVEAGKVQQVVLSSELAEKGIHGLLDVFDRDATDPVLAYLIVSDGSPKELFEKIGSLSEKPRPAFYINQLIESNIQSSYIPETRVFNFDIDYYSEGIDPILPMIKGNVKEVSVIGSALFSKDKMVGRIDTKKTSLLLAMKGKMKKTEYIAPVEDGSSSVGVFFNKAKRDISISINKNKVTVNILLKFDGDVDEYNKGNLDDAKVENSLEKYVANNIKHDCEELLKYTQQVGCDPIGIGDMVRVKDYSFWKVINWKETYKNIAFNVDVTLNIRHYGVIN